MFVGSWQDDESVLESLAATREQSALAWARERADVVVIRLYESMPYSAGRLNPWDGPEWPGLEAAQANPNTTPPTD